MRRGLVGFLFLTILMLSTLCGYAQPYVEYVDDFSADTGLWTYYGSAYRDEKSACLVLTRPEGSQLGVVWLNEEVGRAFTARFSLNAGWETGADGMVFMFYKDQDYVPGYGLGFGGSPGYGIEVHTWMANDMVLIQNPGGEHLAYFEKPRVWGNQSHDIEVRVMEDSVVVKIEGEEVIRWEGELNNTFGGMGFGASTSRGGGVWNWHIIDDVNISVHACPDSHAGLWDEIEEMFSEAERHIQDAEKAGIDTSTMRFYLSVAEDFTKDCDYVTARSYLQGILDAEIAESVLLPLLSILGLILLAALMQRTRQWDQRVGTHNSNQASFHRPFVLVYDASTIRSEGSGPCVYR